jgi:hypothetical protein
MSKEPEPKPKPETVVEVVELALDASKAVTTAHGDRMFLIGVEYGFKSHEKGHNLDMTLLNAQHLLSAKSK